MATAPGIADDDAGAAPAGDRAFLGHPRGLGYLAFVEGCERFSYYSMQTLLTLYMVRYLLLPERIHHVLGLDWLAGNWFHKGGQPLASAIFGTYTALVYLTPIAGGFIADRWLGRRNTLVLGGAVMATGHFLMAFEGSFLFALAALIIGVGLFKGNIASQVGELYGPGDLRRAMAFQVFYTAINVSVIIAPLVAGTLGEKIAWHWGFDCAGVVMVLGLAVYVMARPWLPADNRPRGGKAKAPPLEPGDGKRVLAVVLLVPVMAVALLTNQEIFNAYLVWADEHFELTIFGQTLPTSWMITLDAAASFIMLVAVAAFWSWRARRTGREPDELGKMIIGSGFSIAAGLCLWFAALGQGSHKIGLFWPVMFHLINSIGFAHTLPVSLALFTRLAPRSLNATITGIYYLAFFLANYVVGVVGGWYSTMPTPQFWLVHVASAVIGLVAFSAFKLFLADRLMGKTAPA